MLSRCRRFLAMLTSAVAIATVGIGSAQEPTGSGKLAYQKIESKEVGKSVEYSVLLPGEYSSDGKKLPLLLLLHGGGGSARTMARSSEMLDRLMTRKEIVPMVIVTPSCERSFYMNRHDGKANWENFILNELIPTLRKNLNVEQDRRGLAVMGPSMGGMGSLRLAFKRPELFFAMAAHAPGIEAGTTFKEVPSDKYLPVRSMRLQEDIFGKPVDEDGYWTKNNPAFLATQNVDAIKKSGLKIFLDVGTADTAGCYPGTEYLHKVLQKSGIDHEYLEIKDGKHDAVFFGPAMQRGAKFISKARDSK